MAPSTGNTRNISYHTHTPSTLTSPPVCHIELQHNRSTRETTEILNGLELTSLLTSLATHTHYPTSFTCPPARHIKLQHNRSTCETTEILYTSGHHHHNTKWGSSSNRELATVYPCSLPVPVVTHTHYLTSFTCPPARHIKLQHNRSTRETTEILYTSGHHHHDTKWGEQQQQGAPNSLSLLAPPHSKSS